MRAYYNEWDAPTAAWLRELGRAGHLPDGIVDGRSIRDVRADDVRGFDQCHFFAGIGGWPLALRLAGYEHIRCWTGSPPCQPFSVAGRGLAQADERHLAPVWLDLIHECGPPAIFGEQVADAIGRGWLDDLFDALERFGYACGAAVLPACSVGAPHIRKRLFFGAVRLADAEYAFRGPLSQHREDGCNGTDSRWEEAYGESGTRREVHRVADASRSGLAIGERIGRVSGSASGASARQDAAHGGNDDGTRVVGTCPDHGGWDRADWIGCRDGKFRPVEPGTQPLAHGLPARVGRLRGYGNAIVPQVAATFIKEFLGACAEIAI